MIHQCIYLKSNKKIDKQMQQFNKFDLHSRKKNVDVVLREHYSQFCQLWLNFHKKKEGKTRFLLNNNKFK